jgi:trimethylamine--corrinoid protein Co-methyltransferase
MTVEIEPFTPTLTFLSESGKAQIYAAALQVLAHTGMVLQHDGAAELLLGAGCRRNDQEMITMPAELVEKALQSVPANIPMFNREGDHVMDLGGRRTYFGSGADVMFHIDGKSRERMPTRIKDVIRSARICDALPNIDFIMSFAHPHEIDARRVYVKSFATMAANAIKPILETHQPKPIENCKVRKIDALVKGFC